MTLLRRSLRCLAVGLLLSLGTAGLPMAASAQETASAERTFTLRDGSVARGQLVEFIPNQRVVLLLPDGRVQTLAWAELVSPEQPTPSALLMPVLVQTERPIELYEQQSDGEQRAVSIPTPNPNGPPVETWLRKRGEYRIGGAGVTSEKFKLPEAGSVELSIVSGHRARSIAGLTLIFSGCATSLAGIVTMVGSLFASLTTDSSAVGPPGFIPVNKQLLYSGSVLLPLGLTALVTGLITYSAGKTRFRMMPIYSSAAMQLPGGMLVSARGLEF
jgi:hypothetical protein